MSSAPAVTELSDISPLAPRAALRPALRKFRPLPHARWARLRQGAVWTRAALSALQTHASALPRVVPRDIGNWCPAYPRADTADREAFWIGLISALAKHESTYRPNAVGGGGKWYGLLQILPATARGYGCEARSGQALKNPASNLSCALRIMAVTVPRDGVVSYRMRGVAADWGPFHSRKKRHDMMAWTREQSYCTSLATLRPRLRPDGLVRKVAQRRPVARPLQQDVDPAGDAGLKL